MVSVPGVPGTDFSRLARPRRAAESREFGTEVMTTPTEEHVMIETREGVTIKIEIPLDVLADKLAERMGGARQRLKRLFTRQEAAEYLGRSVRGLDGLVAKGAVASVRGDSRPMFDVRDLDAWIENNKE